MPKKRTREKIESNPPRGTGYRFHWRLVLIITGLAVIILLAYFIRQGNIKTDGKALITTPRDTAVTKPVSTDWIARAKAVSRKFHAVYTPCWEGAYGAIGDGYLYAATGDPSLAAFHLKDHDLRKMCTGTWVDDRAWVCLAELLWWEVTGRRDRGLVEDARRRYVEARLEGRLSRHEGFWSWYNWPPQSKPGERIFTNSNMNQMVTVACRLFEATGDRTFLEDALLVWHGDSTFPGIFKTLYKGNGRWEGAHGLAAFGKQVPWNGAEFCAIGAALFNVTGDSSYRNVVIATAQYIMDPGNGWVDPDHYYQIHMDGNGAFVNFLLDGYSIAPGELSWLLPKIGIMLEHVWTNNDGMSSFLLHREVDNAIRNGWNPNGGEDGYGVDEIGTVHAQGEASRAFGTFAYHNNRR